MIHKLKYGFIIGLTALLISGCATKKSVKKVELSGPDVNSLKELMSVSIEARDEMRLLAKTQEAVAQKSMSKDQHEQRYFAATSVPPGFESKATFSYVGKASKAAQAIAMVAGYKFVIDGKEIPNEPWVHINIKNEPLNEALKELGLQTGDSIRIEVYTNVLRFIYK
jgi:hypothetical protein